MRARGDQRLDQALEAALAARPADALELLEALRRGLGAALARHEGVVHAALRRLVREERAAVVGRSPRGLALYAAPGAAAAAAAAEVGAPAAAAAAATDPWAASVARSVRDARARARITADLAAHRAALAANGREADLGHARHLRGLLGRVDRGRRTVLLPSGLGDHVLRFVLHEGPWILMAVAVFLLLHAFVVQVFVIPSDSMVPTLLRGDRVVVHKRGRGWVPERWRVVTYVRPGPDGPRTTYVKRVVGLPGEDIALWRGDVYADDRLVVKPDDLGAVLRARVKAWDFAGAQPPPGWLTGVTASGARTFAWDFAGQPFWTGTYELERRFGLQDVYLELDVELGARGMASLRLARGELGRAGRSDWSLHVGDGQAWLASGRPADDGTGLQRLENRPAPRTGRVTLRLAIVDGIVRASAGDLAWRGAVDAPDEAATFGFTLDGDARALALRLDQDLHYGVQGGIGVPLNAAARGSRDFDHRVGPDAVFCLGDNSADSRDSRFPEVGDVPLAQLIGPVIFRLWPPGRLGVPR